MLSNLIIKKSINLRAKKVFLRPTLYTVSANYCWLTPARNYLFNTTCLVSGNAEIWLEDSKGKIQKFPLATRTGSTIQPNQNNRIIAATDCVLAEVSSEGSEMIKRPKAKNNSSWIVFLSTFPPRECGIATFTADFALAFNKLFAPMVESKVIAMNVNELTHFHYPQRVIGHINQSKSEEYIAAAAYLNELPQVKLINIQHEFGIFGESWGRNLLFFLAKITKPVIVTFHAVLPNPDPQLLDVVQNICAHSNLVVVMTNLSKKLLGETYGIPEQHITIIPHGIHPLPFVSSESAKAALDLSGHTVLSTFGMLSKGKGIEYVIESLPQVVTRFPKVRYLIIGATHPLIRQQEGEAYRNSLIQKVYELGLTNHVTFYDKHFALLELLEFLKATDIYMSASLNPNQAVSGTLSYGLGAGRPVISTKFAQAQEDITPQTGRLVDFKKPEEFTQAILELLNHDDQRQLMAKNAYVYTRNMTWPNVAIRYMKSFTELVPELGHNSKNLPKVKLAHLICLTDNTGVFQFADLTKPDPAFGYTADDNARALIVSSLFYAKYKHPVALRLLGTYLKFLHAVAKPNGYFDNYVNHDKSFNVQANTEENLEDASARCLYALAVAATQQPIPQRLREAAQKLFTQSLSKNVRFTFLRSAAFYIKGLSLWLSKWYSREVEDKLIQHSNLLLQSFEKHATPEWQWFENSLTYSNAVLPESLCYALPFMGECQQDYFQASKATLDFLITQTFQNGVYMAIGQRGWYIKGSHRALFDQQPEDPAAMVLALKTMFAVTKDARYKKLMYKTFNWFLGDNYLGQIMYDETTGGCYDGLEENQVNLNQGAESSLSYLHARLMVE